MIYSSFFKASLGVIRIGKYDSSEHSFQGAGCGGGWGNPSLCVPSQQLVECYWAHHVMEVFDLRNTFLVLWAVGCSAGLKTWFFFACNRNKSQRSNYTIFKQIIHTKAFACSNSSCILKQGFQCIFGVSSPKSLVSLIHWQTGRSSDSKTMKCTWVLPGNCNVKSNPGHLFNQQCYVSFWNCNSLSCS